MDPQVIATFVAGLCCTLVIMYLFGAFSGKKPALSTEEWRAFPLREKIEVSDSTHIYRFEIPGTLGISTGQHVSVRAPVNGRQVMRSYTPITDHDVEGYVDLMVKSYPTGNLSRVMNELKIGDTVEMKGPKGRFLYEPNMVSRIGMIAGGTGITPCYQVIKAVLQNPADNTKLNLIYANVNEDEILLKKELDALAKQHPTRFSVYYFLDKPPANWTGGTGFVTREAIAEQLPSPSESCRILMCGPPPMMEAMKKHLVSLDFPPARTISKAEDIVFVF